MISEEIYKSARPLSELFAKLGVPNHRHKIPRGISKTNRHLMYKLQQENREFDKKRKNILSRYKIGNYNDHDRDGYSKISVYKHEGVYYV